MFSGCLMRVWIALPIAIILFSSSWYVFQNPNLVEDVIENVSEDSQHDEIMALNVQLEERWLVLLIDFPDNPSTESINLDTAKHLINHENGVSNYLSSVVDEESNFVFDFHNVVLHASYSEFDYGIDSNGIRDSGTELSGGASGLATEALNQANDQGIDWSIYDLNLDSYVDRILILHTGGVQEDGGKTNEIWSHFGFLEIELEFNGSIIHSYAMAGLNSNVGTISHEVLHSFGAADLYAVHDDLPLDNWKGVGDFDIMASGNWAENDAGESRPVLPMAATMNLMGVDRYEEMNVFDLGSNTNTEFSLIPMSSSGIAYRIELSENEFLWLEYRHKSGVDVGLPGSGLLVSIEDMNVGNISLNNINRDSQNPYLMVVEADGNDDLLNGRGSGESSDLFVAGSKFGFEGLEIRERYGSLVPWLIEIQNMTEAGLVFNLRTGDLPIISIGMDSNPVEILGDEQFLITVDTKSECNFNGELFSEDGRILRFEKQLGVGLNELNGEWEGQKDSDSGNVFGIFKCDEIQQLNVKIGWKYVGNRINTNLFEGKIHFEEISEIVIPIDFEGNGSRVYQIEYLGPLERIATTSGKVTLSPGDDLKISIDPQGLLTPGMYARGYIVLHDELYEHKIEVVLQSEFIDGGAFFSSFLESPAKLFSLSLALSGLWFILSISSSGKRSESELVENDFESDVFDHY